MSERTRRHEVRSGMILGAILVALGDLFLLREFFDVDLGRYGWPLFIIGPGLLLLAGMVAGGRGAGGLAVPGSIVTTIGLILFAQNLTGRFETWAYSWALIPAAAGVGLLLAGHRDGNPKQVEEGKGTLRVGLLLFLAFGSWFELFIFRGIVPSTYLFPVALIIGGAALVVWNLLRARREPAAIVEDERDQPVQGTWPI